MKTMFAIIKSTGRLFDTIAWARVQSGAKVKKFNGASKRLRLWAATQLIAHHNRVIALGVHRRSRVDGPRTLDSKA